MVERAVAALLATAIALAVTGITFNFQWESSGGTVAGRAAVSL